MELIPTHILDGMALVQKTDQAGRTYYIDAEYGKRAATKGRSPLPYGSTLPADSESNPPVDNAPALDDDEASADAHAEAAAYVEAITGATVAPADGAFVMSKFAASFDDDSPEAPMPIEDAPTEFDLTEAVVLFTVISDRCPGGRYDHGPYTAIVENTGEVMFCRPAAEGGQERFIITLPTMVAMKARRI